MNIVVIEKEAKSLTIENHTLKTNNHKIPIHLIDYLIISQNVYINSSIFTTFSKNGIPVLFISKNSKHFSLTVPIEAKNSELKIKQYKSIDKKIKIAKEILKKKIISHQNGLKNLGVEIEIKHHLSKIEKADLLDTLLGIEGHFAKIYFEKYFKLFPKHLHKGKRTKNPPLDPINSILSFSYTIFYNLITAKLFSYGFDPTISYLHTPFRSHYALSSDILEIFRGDINLFCAKLFLEHKLKKEDFSNKGGIYLKSSSRRTFWKEIKPFINETEPKIKKEIAILRKMITAEENR